MIHLKFWKPQNRRSDINAEFHQIPRSPCLNPIENIFHVVRKMLEQETIRLQIEHETFTILNPEWCDVLI